MINKISIKKVLFIVGVFVIISVISAGLYIYSLSSKPTITPVKMNETELMDAVRKNIDKLIAQQKEQKQSYENKNTTTKDIDAHDENRTNPSTNSEMDTLDSDISNYSDAELVNHFMNEAPEFNIEKSNQSKLENTPFNFDHLPFNPLAPSTLPHFIDNKPKPTRKIKINSQKELQELIGKWENSDNPRMKMMAKHLRTLPIDKNDVRINIEIEE